MMEPQDPRSADFASQAMSLLGPSAPRRVLFVAYQFPPAGGVGVQRVTKFVKYLPEFGWESSVLTVSNPSVPLMDESFSKDIPAGTIIRRARTLEPGYAVKHAVSKSSDAGQSSWWKKTLKSAVRSASNLVLQPDAQVLWHPAAYREAMKLLAQTRHDAIIATGPPFSSLLLGAKIARKAKLPLILDYRDEWGISNTYWENKGQGSVSNWMQQRQHRTAIEAATALLATTPSSAASVGKTAAEFGLHRYAAHIYNGFDPDDYAAKSTCEPSPNANGKFRLAFIGTLWNLNSIEPLVRAIRQLAQAHSPLLERLELLLAGRRTAEQETLLEQLAGSPVTITRMPFVDHSAAISLMQSANSLLMLNSDVPHAGRIINAKTFEYMATRRPMFVIAPKGDVWDIVRDLPGTVLCEPADVNGIATKLEAVLEQHRCGVSYQGAHWDIDRFHRRELARQLGRLLDMVTPSQNVSAKTGFRGNNASH